MERINPLSSRQKFVLGLIVIATVIVAAGLVFASMIVLDPAIETIRKTDRQVYILGTSDDFETIIDQFNQGTFNIVHIHSLSQLSNITSDTMLFIDGKWIMGNPNATLSSTAAAIAPLILNGTPVVIIDGDDIAIRLVAEDNDLSYLSQQDAAGTVMSHGLFYNQTTGFASCFGDSESGPHDRGIQNTVVRAYNWADDYIAGRMPGVREA